MAARKSITIDAKKLETFVADIFEAAGCSKAEARRIGKYLTIANLTGHDSHGVQRVPRYVQNITEKTIVIDQTVKVVSETPVLAVVDGRYGFGQTVTPQAVQIGIDKCKAMGLSAVALRNAGHIGRVGDWAEMAAADGLVSIHFVNAHGSVLVAPFGGVDKRFSTAPYCVGIPMKRGGPLVLDFATSIVAEGKVLVSSFGGKAIPDDALIEQNGKVSNDPHVLYGDYTPTGPRKAGAGKGAIRAFGDHKGSGLAFMCEVLGGSLTGTGATTEGRQFCNGMMSFYIDPEKLDPSGFFPKDVAAYVKHVKSAKPVKRGGEVLVPGEQEARMRTERSKEGVPLPLDTWNAIVETARAVGVADARMKKVL
jgi:hydroxycarboxylate dehydrogenase B